jgi:hypothetical protein
MQIRLPGNLWDLVAASAGTSWPPRDRAESSRFVAACAREGLLPLAFRTLSLEAFDLWRAMDFANQHRTTIISRTIAELPELIGGDYLLLKGSDIAYRLYPSPELRPMGDIDILIHPEDRDRVVARLEESGARRRYWRTMHFSPANPDYAFDLGAITLEVHHAIVHRASARIDDRSIWQASRMQPHGRVVCDCDALIIAALNLAKDNLAGSLLHFVDLWLMLSASDSIATDALARARSWQVANALHSVLRMTAMLFPDLHLTLPRRPILDRLAAQAVRSRTMPGWPGRLWRKYWLIDRLGLRVHYLFAMSLAAAQGFARREEIGGRPSRETTAPPSQ